MSKRVFTTIATLRHGKTEHGAQHRYAGSLDVPLSDEGRQACHSFRSLFSDLDFDVVITSPQRRARETAELVVGPGAPVIEDPLIVERRYGRMEGLTATEVQALEPPVRFVELGGDTHSVNPVGGEPLEDVWWRARQFTRQVLDAHAGKRVLVVSHSAYLMMLHGVLRGLTFLEAFGPTTRNLELTTFTLADGELVREDTSHPAHLPEDDF